MKNDNLKTEYILVKYNKPNYTKTLIISALVLFSATVHDFHTSITRMDFNAKDKAFEVSIRVFTDDLEKTISLENSGQKFIILNNDKNNPTIEKYIRKHFNLLNTQKQKRSYNYIGKEQEADATWIYIEIPLTDSPTGLTLQNDIMHEVFEDQINLVNLKLNTTKKSYIFKKNEPIQALNL
jgi:hypothetical protein